MRRLLIGLVAIVGMLVPTLVLASPAGANDKWACGTNNANGVTACILLHNYWFNYVQSIQASATFSNGLIGLGQFVISDVQQNSSVYEPFTGGNPYYGTQFLNRTLGTGDDICNTTWVYFNGWHNEAFACVAVP